MSSPLAPSTPLSVDTGTIRIWNGSRPPSNAGRDEPPAPPPADRLEQALDRMPGAGDQAFGFRLVRELGRGSFGRVFLATQPDLGGRPVALKVSPDLAGEGRTLARLQHTNIVPVHSTHRDGLLQAVCMPYFGSATLADLLRQYRDKNHLPATGRELVQTLKNLTGRTRPDVAADPPPADPVATPAAPPDALLAHLSGDSYVRAVCWLAARLADGLAHAHARGILHRDIKPANVLLTDDGQPMLLDFGIAEDLKLRAGGPAAPVGGTVPYMAPEHLAEVQGGAAAADARSDVYSLGVVVYELLTGRYPFRPPTGALADEAPRILAERQAGPPPLRPHNPEVTPGLESVVRTCLAPDPAGRYQSAADLRDDLERYLADQPLKVAPEASVRERGRKWARRHPRLSSNATLATLAALLMAAGGYAYSARADRLARLEAAEVFRQFQADTRNAPFLLNAAGDRPDRVKARVAAAVAALDRYALDAPDWDTRPLVAALPADDQARLRKQLAELCVLIARGTVVVAHAGDGDRTPAYAAATRWNDRAEAVTPGATPRAVFAQRVKLCKLRGDQPGAEAAGRRAAVGAEWSAEDHHLAGTTLLGEGKTAEALAHFRVALKIDPTLYWSHLGEGACHDLAGRPADARGSYHAAVALAPDFAPALFNRGSAHLRLGDAEAARDDLTAAAATLPDFTELYLQRAAAHLGTKQYAEGVRDVGRALELGASPARAYFLRADLKRAAGDAAGATADVAEAVTVEPTTEAGWVERGRARWDTDRPGALADFDRALAVNPTSLPALLNRAYVLQQQDRPDDVLATLDRAVAADPTSAQARAERGLAHAHAGRWEPAKADARAALTRADGGGHVLYQVAATYARVAAVEPAYRPRAVDLASVAVRAGVGRDLLATDPSFAAVKGEPGFHELTAR